VVGNASFPLRGMRKIGDDQAPILEQLDLVGIREPRLLEGDRRLLVHGRSSRRNATERQIGKAQQKNSPLMCVTAKRERHGECVT
jgi:hypothetical protein